MTITDMHILFRQFAQQAGMQNVKAILPSQIDLVINTTIVDTTNQLIREAITIPENSIVVDYGKVGRINALLPLQDTEEIEGITDSDIWTFTESFNPYYIYKLDIEYDEVKNRIFPIDITENKFISDKLSDYILSPKLFKPLAVINNTNIKFYFSKTDKFDKSKVKIRVFYIRTPQKVNYIDKINCDLPEYLHSDIVKQAVELHVRSLNLGPAVIGQEQQQTQPQQYNQQQNQ